jgi:capsular polysaccharide biosynthesis protein
MARVGTRTGLSARLRRRLLRLSGPLADKRSGYFFIVRRVLAARLKRPAASATAPSGVALDTLEEMTRRVPGATYRELEPQSPDAPTPPGWELPRSAVDDSDIPSDILLLGPGAGRGEGVVEIPGGVVFGAEGTYGPDPDHVLLDANAMWPDDRHFLLAHAAAARAIGEESLPGVTVSTMAHSDNYCHWLLQNVPRLDLLRRGFGFDADRILVRETHRPMIEALTLLGIPTERMHITPRGSPVLRCEVLRAATSPLVRDFGVSWTAEFLQELYLPEPPAERTRRLYVQRGVANRATLNDEEVRALLEPAGFETMAMDGRSVAEQAELFAGAEVVVSPHGAALANTVFCRPGTTVIELLGRNTVRTCFARLAWRRELDYEMVLGTEPAIPARLWDWQMDADTAADVPALRKALERRGIL